jgi:hypothetical protein
VYTFGQYILVTSHKSLHALFICEARKDSGNYFVRRWEDDAMNDLKLLKIKSWTKRIQNREEWRKIVEKVKACKKWSCTLRRTTILLKITNLMPCICMGGVHAHAYQLTFSSKINCKSGRYLKSLTLCLIIRQDFIFRCFFLHVAKYMLFKIIFILIGLYISTQ